MKSRRAALRPRGAAGIRRMGSGGRDSPTRTGRSFNFLDGAGMSAGCHRGGENGKPIFPQIFPPEAREAKRSVPETISY